ncbi:metal-dependent hydrolase [Candidatus Pacearchaeota archaeon]|nr:metal-dependent hydrolase [Candidatus Pacearchaeota archaeon]
MPLAVTHFVIAVILITLFRDYFVKNKKDFPIYYVFMGGLAGLLPDIDFLFVWISYIFGYDSLGIHRTITHSLFFPLIFILFSLIFIKAKPFKINKSKITYSKLFLIISAGILMHLILDGLLSGSIIPFYPASNIEFGLDLVGLIPNANLRDFFFPTLDAILLILWISYLEYKHEISSFF